MPRKVMGAPLFLASACVLITTRVYITTCGMYYYQVRIIMYYYICPPPTMTTAKSSQLPPSATNLPQTGAENYI